jgi:hypothetical protein
LTLNYHYSKFGDRRQVHGIPCQEFQIQKT